MLGKEARLSQMLASEIHSSGDLQKVIERLMIRGREEGVGPGGLGKAVPRPVGILRGKMGRNRQGAAAVSLWLVFKGKSPPPNFLHKTVGILQQLQF